MKGKVSSKMLTGRMEIKSCIQADQVWIIYSTELDVQL